MGVTIRCKKTGSSCDLGYGGFGRFRQKVAELYSKEFGEHYAVLSDTAVMLLTGDKSKEYFEQYNAKTDQMIDEKLLNIKVANFCYQCDCGGNIRYGACKVIYDCIKDYDDDYIYGYAGREDRAKFKNLKALFKECYENKCNLEWG